ncbi:hypothetical protein CA267_010425 [Alteromonas pelagimontana]|uniref:Uncharacterized protein n=1 Tax=Alteromonas pelagimontana TaxID=1858656 RepID=A0A6M4MEY7_9ALTE|nr:peptide chain release factor-like protein [Alteromonas pelagimontana]QJR81165.1 hypothetical protein CA267_010425 [Alteromonas pelagimontana]
MSSFSANLVFTVIPSSITRLAATHVGVEVLHVPTGFIARSVDLPSQYLNQQAALAILASRLTTHD